MRSRVPWAIWTVAVSLAFAGGRADALFDPTTYLYLWATPDTVVAKCVTLAAGGYDTTRIVSLHPGSACSDSSDTLGCGTHVAVYATSEMACSLFTNGGKVPMVVDMPANTERTLDVRWVDSVITRAASPGVMYMDIEGHVDWFTKGWRY